MNHASDINSIAKNVFVRKIFHIEENERKLYHVR